MRSTNKNLRAGITIMMLVASMSLTSCGKRVGTTAVVPTPSVAPQSSIPVEDLSNTYNQTTNIEAVANGTPNAQISSFKVDQATFSAWQAKGIAVSGGTIYVSVADTKGLLQYGSVIKMGSSDGKSWKNIGTAFLGLSHPISKTVQGLAISGNTLLAVDSAKSYIIDASKAKVTVVKTTSGTDVAAGGSSVFIANGSTVSKTDSSLASSTPIIGLTATGGIGADNQGNVYAVSGVTIKKADLTNQVQDVVTTNLASPIDVAVDSRNGDLYVLDGTMIKRFTSSGQLSVSFSSSATKPVAITVDEGGAVYVADQGSSNKDSQILK
ncbi:MAG: hypothetical protein H7263_06310, partial [Candidatus Sericytochromatia bacterium]|nr:hypothetical protein [Candidatus Sericytochromatia bacterium]